MKLGNCFSKFVNQSSSFPELFLDLTTTEPEPELFSFCLFVFLGEPEPELAKLDRPGSSWSRDRVAWTSLPLHNAIREIVLQNVVFVVNRKSFLRHSVLLFLHYYYYTYTTILYLHQTYYYFYISTVVILIVLIVLLLEYYYTCTISTILRLLTLLPLVFRSPTFTTLILLLNAGFISAIKI